jgi:hypothetical protein
MALKKISQYVNTATSFADNDLQEVSTYVSPGVYQTAKYTWLVLRGAFATAFGFKLKNNLGASGIPTVSDDTTQGYAVGSLWGYNGNIYICSSASTGAATWVAQQVDISGKLDLDGSNANSDIDISNIYSIYAKSLHIKGIGGSGHLGIKHQSAGITANPNESSFSADSSGNPIWKNDGNAQQRILLNNNNLSDVSSANTAMNNILPSKTSNALKVLRVNAGATDYELATISGGSTALNSIIAATATNSISNGNYLQTWNWNLDGVSSNGLEFLETGTTGTGYFMRLGTTNGANTSLKPIVMYASGFVFFDTAMAASIVSVGLTGGTSGETSIGTSATTGSVKVGGALTSGTLLLGPNGTSNGTVTISHSSGTNIVNIAATTNGIKTVNIANNNGSSATTVNIANNTSAIRTVNIANSTGKIGFFGTTAVVKQTGGAATAGGTYTATEQTMINAMYTALRNYGLLT